MLFPFLLNLLSRFLWLAQFQDLDDFIGFLAIVIIATSGGREQIDKPPYSAAPKGQVFQDAKTDVPQPEAVEPEECEDHANARILFFALVLALKDRFLSFTQILRHHCYFHETKACHVIPSIGECSCCKRDGATFTDPKNKYDGVPGKAGNHGKDQPVDVHRRADITAKEQRPGPRQSAARTGNSEKRLPQAGNARFPAAEMEQGAVGQRSQPAQEANESAIKNLRTRAHAR